MPKRVPIFHPFGDAPARRSADAYERRRGSARKRGYTSQWDKASADYRRAHPVCVGCLALGRGEPTTCVDHVIPAEDMPRLFWVRSNWQASCEWHHSVVKQRLERMWRVGEIGDSDLRLDSEAAIALSRDLAQGGGGVKSP